VLVVWTLLALVAGLLLVLAIPVELAFSVQRYEGRQKSRGTLGWFFGLVRLHLGGPKVRVKAKSQRHEIKRRHGRRGGAHRVSAILRIEGFGWRLLRLGRDVLERIHIQELSLKIRLGLEDPADTGRLWAIVGPLAAMLTLPPVARVTIQPEFTTEALELDGKGRIRIIPINLLFVVLVFLLSPMTLRALYSVGRKA
jgi:4-amino-4-deoxy-L-arabinose transferase-like glycosyltransferase